MRIGVDLHVLTGKFQGSRRYLSNIYRSLLSQDRTNEYFLFVNDAIKLREPWLSLGQLIEFGTTSSLSRLTWASPLLSKRHKLDMFHFQYVSPLWIPSLTLLTVHDILFETHPQYFTIPFVLRSRALVRRSCQSAEHIFTVSEYCKSMISELYRIPASNISVTPNGVDTSIFHSIDRETSRKIVQQLFGVSDFILTVGRLEPRKNHIGLIKAYKRLRNQLKDVPRLVIVGQRDFRFKEIFEEIQSSGLEKQIIIMEDVEDEVLAHLYRSALCFVYPSFAEGFGIPLVEAMACGCPVITSNTTSMPEVVEDAGLLVNPVDDEQIAESMQRLIEDSALQADMSARGLKRVVKFDWDSSASAMKQTFDVIASKRARRG